MRLILVIGTPHWDLYSKYPIGGPRASLMQKSNEERTRDVIKRELPQFSCSSPVFRDTRLTLLERFSEFRRGCREFEMCNVLLSF